MASYIEALKQAAVIFPVLATAFTIPYIAYNYHKYGSIWSLRILIVYSFMLYMLCAYCLVILPLPTGEAAKALHGHDAQLVPFAFIGDIIENSNIAFSQPRTWLNILGESAFWTTVFNFVMTLPFGAYLRYYFRCGWKKTLLLSFLLSLFFELTQLTGLYFIYPGSYRLFDVDDLMVNTLGSMAGFAIAGVASKFLPSREELDRESFIRGRRVSLLRRMVAFLYDGIVYVILAAIAFMLGVNLFGGVPAWGYAILAIAYFTLCPAVLRGQTIGHRLTKLRIVGTDGGRARWYQYALRYALLIALLAGLPVAINVLVSALADAGLIGGVAAVVAYGVVDGGYLFLLFFEAVRMGMRRELFYERWSRTKLASTVSEEK